MEGHVKGNQINFTKKYLMEEFGTDALNQVIKHLGEKTKATIIKPTLDIIWEPEEAYVDLLAAIEKTFGKGDYELCRRIGLYIAEESIPKFYKPFIRLGNVSFVISNAPRFWRQIHDNGNLEISISSKHSATGRLINKAYPSKAFCFSLMGYIEGVLQMCGAKNISVKKIKCVTDGEEFCEFTTAWE